MREDIRSFVASVQKPGRYTGGETNSVYKNPEDVKMRVAFCFPDTYEIGMSNLGMRILCDCFNAVDGVWCERVYAPWIDMEEEMRRRSIPLFTHESGDSVGDFDVAAFTMQYELCYTTMLNMLDLAGIPLRRDARGENNPIILAGGPCAYNPEPMADFVDVFSIGEGEEALPEFARLYLSMKEDGSYTKEAFLYRVATELKGFYVPALYDISYKEDGTIAAITPADEKVPAVVTKRVVGDFDKCYVPLTPVLPNIETVHDRVTMEVFRGCIRGCRFCQAGMVCRPVREKSPETLDCIARTQIENSGYSEISLSSLSISDYSKISELTDKLLDWTTEKMINLSLPSMRADSFTKELMDKISTVRSSTLTFAPEAGTARLRDIINKNITEEELLRAAGVAYAAGKNQVKLYFMNGLPGETYEDIEGISTLASHVVDEYFRTPNRNKARQPQVTLSVACFIPKPHTPFQWERQNTLDELTDKQDFLSSKIKDRKVRYNYHDAKVSRLEAVFARGDRRLSVALEEAIRRGVRFDAWEDQFDYDQWMDIFASVGVDPAFYANRTIPDEEILPWDMISCGVTKEFLLSERHKAQEAIATPSCKEKCSGCGVNKLVDKQYCRWCPGHPKSSDSAGRITSDKELVIPEKPPKGSVKAARHIRVRFRKFGAMLYISHLDLSKTLTRAIVRSGLPVYYTEGFNPIPKLVFATPLSVGCGGENEVLDIRMMKAVGNQEIMEKLKAAMPNGIEITAVYEQKSKLTDIKWAENEITFRGVNVTEDICKKIEEMFTRPVLMMKRSKSGEKECDITTLMRGVKAVCEADTMTVTAMTSADQENYLNPEYVAQAIVEAFPIADEKSSHWITRKKLFLGDGETEFI
ncbi:MAG: TIGR03960 family B12-binding radical SAM protein [Clostridia bacterium]|nr:TIGR03960 family B12-binding radical SAM protein [Clostridia bacterium]